jgi:integrase
MKRIGRPSKGGAHKVTVKGVEYWYAWKGAGAPRLQSPPGTRAFDAELKRLRGEQPPSPAIPVTATKPPMLSDVIDGYFASVEFSQKAPRTQKDYRRLADSIRDRFGDLELVALQNEADEVHGAALDWRDEVARGEGKRGETNLRQADYAYTVLNLILNWGRQRGKIKLNPLRDAGVKNLYTGTRRDQVWTPELAAAFCADAPAELRLGFMLAYWTGQRQGDLVRLPWGAYDGETITLTQSKGGVPVAVPAAAPLKALLDGAPRKSPMILVNQDGRPWSEWGFGFMFSRTKNKLGMPALTFHDLRGTVASDLQDAGCTEAQITAVTGHKLIKNEVLDRNYLRRNLALARPAIALLEAYRSGEKSFPKYVQPIDFIEAKKRRLEN